MGHRGETLEDKMSKSKRVERNQPTHEPEGVYEFLDSDVRRLFDIVQQDAIKEDKNQFRFI